MRVISITMAAMLGLSAAALGQVAANPTEQKPAPSTDSALSSEMIANAVMPANEATADTPMTDDPTATMGNDVAAPHQPDAAKPR